jgi:hypothetical protein
MADEIDFNNLVDRAANSVPESQRQKFGANLQREMIAAINRAADSTLKDAEDEDQDGLRGLYNQELEKIPHGAIWQITELQARYRKLGLKI